MINWRVGRYLGLVFGLLGQASYAADTSTLPSNITQKIAAAKLPVDSVSILVQPLTTTSQPKPEALIRYQADIPRTPASTQKLIPTFIALDSLGKDFSWQTQLWLDGVIMGDTFFGDVIIKGGGDPKLADDEIASLLGHLSLQGIRQIAGNIVIDNHIFRQVNYNPNAFDGKGLRPYNAMPNGLLVNFGTLTVTLLPNDKVTQSTTQDSLLMAVPSAIAAQIARQQASKQEADMITALTSPVVPASTTTASTGAHTTSAGTISQKISDESTSAFSQFLVKLTPTLASFDVPTMLTASQQACRGMTEEKLVNLTADALRFLTIPSANCGHQQSYWLTYPDGDKLINKTVTAHIRKQFPNFSGQVIVGQSDNYQTTSPLGRVWQKLVMPRLVAIHHSAPLADQINDINHYSNNVMTEQVALSLPVYAQNKPYSDYPATFDYIQQWWHNHLPNHTPPIMTRASGLCRDCRITPSSLMAVLDMAYHSRDFATYQASLPIAGISGTMKHLKERQPDNPAIGRAWIKTGTLDNVASMAGYVQAKSGRWYAVVAMINAPSIMYNTQAKAVLDETLAWTALQ